MGWTTKGETMSKLEAFQYCQESYPSMRWSRYKTRDGAKVLWAIFFKLRERNGEMVERWVR